MSQTNVQRTITATILGMFTAAILSFVAVMPASAGKPDAAAAAKPGGKATITEIVLDEDDEFDVLQAAVIKAGLAETLDGKRQFTVFAPTDAAFISSLGAEDEADAIDIVNSFDKGTLTNILLYHVTSGRKISTAVLASPSQQMLNGDKLPISELGAAGIAATDISAKNGVVHVINSVLMP